MALSDVGRVLATPLGFFRRKQPDLDVDRALEVVVEQDVGSIVVGMPLSMSGEMGVQAQRVQVFMEALRERSPVPVESWDERLSTWEAERLLREAGRKPSRERGRADAASAAVILQSYLDAMRNKAPKPP